VTDLGEVPGPTEEPAALSGQTVGGLNGGPVSVVITGELDLSTLPDAERQVAAAERAEPSVLIIDLSGLTFVDSSGVRPVLMAQDRARSAGRRLAVKLGEGPAVRVFQTLGLTAKLDLVPDDGVTR